VDERVIEHFRPESLSIGDYVIAGGEVAAMVVIEAVTRLLPGVIGNEESIREESFSEALIEYPQYTRPALFREHAVPEILLSGDHAAIAAWRRERMIERTRTRRPDLLAGAEGGERRAEEE
jgi:tRNA (guanine37-N1)-methyltransferase